MIATASLPVIHTMSYDSLGLRMPQIRVSDFASGAYLSANRALFIPFRVRFGITVTKLASFNGATAGNNIDMGVYSPEPGGGRLIVSTGGIAQAGTSALQIFDVTDKYLAPGDYYMAVAMDGTTGTLLRSTIGIGFIRGAGVSQMSSAYPLPATVTFAAPTIAYLPEIALLQGRTIL